MEILHEKKIRLLLMRCAGFNNVDLDTAKKYGIRIMRVPGYSPEAVAEHAMALALASNRRLYKAYNKVRENDFSLSGLMGFNFYQKTAGIIGTGKIGAAMCRICHGFGMKVIAYDVYQNDSLKDFVEYVSLEQLLSDSDVISLHCPLTDSSYHLINIDTIKKMKDGVLKNILKCLCELPEKVTLNAVNSAKILGLSEKNSCKIERNSHSNYLVQYPNKSSVYQHF